MYLTTSSATSAEDAAVGRCPASLLEKKRKTFEEEEKGTLSWSHVFAS